MATEISMKAPFAIGCIVALACTLLASQEDCCAAKVNLGFSTELSRSRMRKFTSAAGRAQFSEENA